MPNKKTREKNDPRVNLALRPELYEYAKLMAGIRGQSITAFLNDLLAANMERNAVEYEKAKAINLTLE